MPSKLNRKDTKKWRRRRKLRRFLISSWVVVDIHVSLSFNCLHILFRDGWWVGPVNGPGKTWFWVGLGWHLNLKVRAHLELDLFIDCNRNVNSNIKMPSQHLKSTRSWVFKFGWKCQLDHRISTFVSGQLGGSGLERIIPWWKVGGGGNPPRLLQAPLAPWLYRIKKS